MQTVGTLIPSGFTLYVGPVNEAKVFAQWNDVYEFTYETNSGLLTGLATGGLRITRDPVMCLVVSDSPPEQIFNLHVFKTKYEACRDSGFSIQDSVFRIQESA